eukprot:4542128-Pleurochrysis_carterae.AAC.1
MGCEISWRAQRYLQGSDTGCLAGIVAGRLSPSADREQILATPRMNSRRRLEGNGRAFPR